MKILTDYIIKEWFKLFLLSLLVVSFVLLVGNVTKLVELMIDKGVYIYDVIKLFLFILPSMLIYSIPISTLTATLLCFGRLASDNEIIAMRSSGISLYHVVVDLILIGLLFSLLGLYFNDSLLPKTHYRMRSMLLNIGMKNPTAYLEERTFIKTFKNYIIFIYRIKADQLENIRIYQPRTDKPPRMIIAKRGQIIQIPGKDILKVELRDGMADESSFKKPGQPFKLNFKTYPIVLQLKDRKDNKKLDKKNSDMNIAELRSEIETIKNMGIDEAPLRVGLHKKFALAFSSLIFILLGFPLAVRVKRRERSLGFGLSLIVCLVYYLILAGGESLALRNIIPAFWGVWIADIVFLFTSLFLIIKFIEE
ncbi:MAG: LptF/LptG family permease [Gammaproteobacteria bacterium]|nr:LptF/LptG family permease [Gammaproteobacteria bacterium]